MKKPATSARRADIGPRRYGPSADSRASARQGGGTYVPKALPEGTATTMASARPIFTLLLWPFQTVGVATGWAASNNLTASNAV